MRILEIGPYRDQIIGSFEIRLESSLREYSFSTSFLNMWQTWENGVRVGILACFFIYIIYEDETYMNRKCDGGNTFFHLFLFNQYRSHDIHIFQSFLAFFSLSLSFLLLNFTLLRDRICIFLKIFVSVILAKKEKRFIKTRESFSFRFFI